MIVYPSWPCNYPQAKIKNTENPLIQKDVSKIDFDSLLEYLFKNFQSNQPTLFDDLLIDSKLLPSINNPIQDLYESLGQIKVSPDTKTITGKALVDKQIIDSILPEGFQSLSDEKGIIDLSSFAHKFGVSKYEKYSNDIVSVTFELRDDGYYFVSLERNVHINQIIF
jgi:hypothetical protein